MGYEMLGVSPTATQQEVKDAFYRLSKDLHPSKNPDSPDAAEKFDKLLAAYGVIGNPKRRYFHLSTTTSVSYYETLGVSPTATQQEVKDAFYRLSKELHPSKNPDLPDAAEKFDKLLAAYGVIGNPKRRYFHLSTTTSVSYYETLGVSPTATQQEVKDAF